MVSTFLDSTRTGDPDDDEFLPAMDPPRDFHMVKAPVEPVHDYTRPLEHERITDSSSGPRRADEVIPREGRVVRTIIRRFVENGRSRSLASRIASLLPAVPSRPSPT